jgi:hypothetical protein
MRERVALRFAEFVLLRLARVTSDYEVGGRGWRVMLELSTSSGCRTTCSSWIKDPLVPCISGFFFLPPQ